jgi:hypothetical protein
MNTPVAPTRKEPDWAQALLDLAVPIAAFGVLWLIGRTLAWRGELLSSPEIIKSVIFREPIPDALAAQIQVAGWSTIGACVVFFAIMILGWWRMTHRPA